MLYYIPQICSFRQTTFDRAPSPLWPNFCNAAEVIPRNSSVANQRLLEVQQYSLQPRVKLNLCVTKPRSEYPGQHPSRLGPGFIGLSCMQHNLERCNANAVTTVWSGTAEDASLP